MHEGHDKGYRLIFSHPQMVEDLLQHFVTEPWIADLDFSTLEKVSERDISSLMVRREKDLLWRLKYGSGEEPPDWLYVFVHLEFQSEIDRYMALREALYKLLLWDGLVRQGTLLKSLKLPPVLSLTVYKYGIRRDLWRSWWSRCRARPSWNRF